MKSTAYLLIFLLFFPHCVSFKEPDSQNSRQQIKRKTQSILRNQPLELKGNNRTNQIKKHKAVSKRRMLAKKATVKKEKILPINFHQAQKSKVELQMKFDQHLENLRKTCEIQENKKLFFTKQLNSFNRFLKTSLKDFNMDYTLQLLFADVSGAIDEKNHEDSINLESFILFYKRLYNLPEDIEVKDYPDEWAQIIVQSINCS